ncbi:MAG: hypothetical protein HY855_23335 [Burkholderiales bacterium]|nr:hypothetical protein [Burkholderiales bacterium]
MQDTRTMRRPAVARRAAAALAALSMAGCATTYGSAGLTGGYNERPVNDRLVKVDFYGNGFITADKIQAFALYRCAEVARDARKPYFMLYDSLGAAARGVSSQQPRVGTLGGKPAAFAIVALLDQPRAGAQAVAEVIAQLAPMVQAANPPGGVSK